MYFAGVFHRAWREQCKVLRKAISDPPPQVISIAVDNLGSKQDGGRPPVYAFCARETDTVELQLLPQRWGIPCGCGGESEAAASEDEAQWQGAITMPGSPQTPEQIAAAEVRFNSMKCYDEKRCARESPTMRRT